MARHKSKSSNPIERSKDNPIQVQDDLERDIQRVINEDRIDLKEKLQPIFTAVRMQPNNGSTREDVAKKYEAFLKSVSQVMNVHNIIGLNIGHFIDPHSVNSTNYASLELTSHGILAEHCDRSIMVENVLDVLYDLEEPEQILRSLICQIVKETNINKRKISELESNLEFAERIMNNLNSRTPGADNYISNDEDQVN